eukprot:5784722-Pleurochrysis_carterae.AAC.1
MSRELGGTASDAGRSTSHTRQSTLSAHQGPAEGRWHQALCHGSLDQAAGVRSSRQQQTSTRIRTKQRWRGRMAPSGHRW